MAVFSGDYDLQNQQSGDFVMLPHVIPILTLSGMSQNM
jgi:hypothetical protein